MKYIRLLRKRAGLSEQGLADKAGLSRLTLRQIESGTGNPTLGSLARTAEALDRDLIVLLAPKHSGPSPDSSTVAVSLRVQQDGFDSWPLHFMQLVDDFRKHQDPRLLLLPPSRGLDRRLEAMLASIAVALCEEVDLDPPPWSLRPHFLDTPWFVSGVRSLQALAIVEAPLAFRRNNIFVHENFLARA